MTPANKTAKLQPLDQGIIRVVKLSYCKAITEKVLAHINAEKPDLQNIMNWQSLWWHVKIS